MVQRDYGFGRFLQLLFARRFPDWLRYGAATALAAFFVALRISLPLSESGFVLFIPAVLTASLAFGPGPGLLTTGLTTVAAVIFLIEPRNQLYIPTGEVFSVFVYVAIGCGVALLCHVLRVTMNRAIAAERSKTVLLEELSHRTKNDLQMVASLLMLQARGLPDSEARGALDAAATRVMTVAKLHNRLRSDGSDGVVDMHDYLDDLCADLSKAYGELRPVAIRVKADHAILGTATAAPLGLIVNELVTNAFKYAFPGNREGVVEVAFEHRDAGLTLVVRDNGVGSTDAVEGLGSRLIRLMVQQLNGQLQRAEGGPGTLTTVTIPPP